MFSGLPPKADIPRRLWPPQDVTFDRTQVSVSRRAASNSATVSGASSSRCFPTSRAACHVLTTGDGIFWVLRSGAQGAWANIPAEAQLQAADQLASNRPW